MPKLVIDARMIGPVPHGMARYVSALARGLGVLRSERRLDYEPVFLISPEFHAPPGWPGFAAHVARSPFLAPSELVEIPLVLRSLGADLYHSPSFSSLLYCPCPWIVTVHDLNHLAYGSRAKKLYYRAVLKRFMRGASACVTVSEFSRQEISQWLGVPASGIEIAYNALDPDFTSPISDPELDALLARFGLERGRYFYCPSNPKPHKNLALLTQAYQELREREPQAWPLVLTIREDLGVGGVLPIGGLSDRQGRALMAAAGAVVFPSLYEGFGLPPLEGAALGVPVICSEIPPHREALRDLAGDETLWVDPQNFAGWARALEKAIHGQAPRASEASRRKLVERYSVERLGRHMDQIYRRVLDLSQ